MKNKKDFKFLLLPIIFGLLLFPKPAKAVVPPDFVFNIGAQVAQLFSLIVIFFTAIFGTLFQFFKTRFYAIKHKKIVIAAVSVFFLASSLGLAYLLADYEQRVAYEQWLKDIKSYGAPAEEDKTPPTQDKSLMISNAEFKELIDSQSKDYVVLDARENVEYEYGHFPESLHIRFADLRAGRWQELPEDKRIIVLCWSGMRGKETAEFLRTNNVVASYLEDGANGWYEFGGKWDGLIKFNDKYSESRYTVVFTTADVKSKMKDGVVLVDSREPDRYKDSHIAGSISIPIMYTPTNEIEKVFRQVPAGSTVITVCDGYINCFDAKITGVELERRGYKFLGRYAEPWKYGE